VAITVAVWMVLAVIVDVALPRASFVDGVAVVFMVPLCFIGTKQTVRLWRGTVPHTVINYVPYKSFITLEGMQGFAPCGVVAMDGLALSFVVLLVSGGRGTVGGPLGYAGAVVFLVFTLLGVCVSSFHHPRLLLPATMRPGRCP
jgi:hypothetical protein